MIQTLHVSDPQCLSLPDFCPFPLKKIFTLGQSPDLHCFFIYCKSENEFYQKNFRIFQKIFSKFNSIQFCFKKSKKIYEIFLNRYENELFDSNRIEKSNENENEGQKKSNGNFIFQIWLKIWWKISSFYPKFKIFIQNLIKNFEFWFKFLNFDSKNFLF